jgi:hypothetical protein
MGSRPASKAVRGRKSSEIDTSPFRQVTAESTTAVRERLIKVTIALRMKTVSRGQGPNRPWLEVIEHVRVDGGDAYEDRWCDSSAGEFWESVKRC